MVGALAIILSLTQPQSMHQDYYLSPDRGALYSEGKVLSSEGKYSGEL